MFLKGNQEFSCGLAVGVDGETEGKHKTFQSQMEEKKMNNALASSK